jgi:hypothetical protein
MPGRSLYGPFMRAKAPLDVDLEDKLLYGLTPMRLAYLVVALLGGFALWSSPWAPSPLRTGAGLAVAGIGAAAAWGRWRGRAVDAWVADISIFVINTHRVTLNKRWLQRNSARPSLADARWTPTNSQEIVVTGRAPRAGASTVAMELAACLAVESPADKLWAVRVAQSLSGHEPGATTLHVAVAAVDAGRVCYLDRGTGPCVAALIPEDDCVPQAAALNQATVVAFPDAPASRAFRKLAEVIAAAR